MRGYFHSRAIVAAFVVGSLSVGAHAQDAGTEGVILAPSSDWHVDYADEKCRLARSFGEGENRHVLFLDQSQPSARFQLTLAGPAFKDFTEIGIINLQFGSTIRLRDPVFMKGDISSIGPALVYPYIDLSPKDEKDENVTPASLPMLDVEGAKDIFFIAVGKGKNKVTLKTGSVAAAFGAINTCALDLIRSWGLDPDKHRTMTRTAEIENFPSIARNVDNADVGGSLKNGGRAIFNLRVIVDETGNVVECRLDSLTKGDQLESPACKLFRTGKFKPALDAAGQPMRSFYATTVTYEIN